MADFFKYIVYCFSLIPTWLTAVFVALLVFVVTYLYMLCFTDHKDEDSIKKDEAYEKSAEFDDLLATVLASKEKANNANAIFNIKQPEISTQKSVSPAVVAAISAVVSKTCPSGTICSIESV